MSYQDLIQETPRIYKDLPVGLCYLDTDFRFIHINDWLAEINGMPAEEHLGRTMGELIPDVAAGVETQFRQVIDTGEPIIGGTVEAETSAQPGIKRHFQHSYYPVRSDDGEVIGISCVVEDVTVRNEALAALRQAHEELEQRVQERSAELQKINESLELEISQRLRAEQVLQDNEQALQDRIEQLEEAQRTLERQGADLVRLANDLRFARDEARAADRAKSEFLAAMSHELRTPLNAIIGFSEIIKTETFGPVGSVKYREYANDINNSGQHLLDLINDILDLSKIESGTDKLHENTIEIPEIIRAALKLVGPRAERGGIKLELELPGWLPALRADERKLKQILVNLLSNAIKFTDADGEVTLRVWCRMDSGYVFQIVDTGIGIAPEDIPKALLRFGQVDGDLNRQYEGTGLGLPLTKALVEQHGGALDLQSEVGVGTTVTVRFPAERIVASLDNLGSLDVEARAVS